MLSRSTERTAGRVGIALSAVAVVAGIVIGLAAVGNPGDWLNDRWQDFKGDYDKGGFQTSRLTGDLGSGRYDFWSVGLNDEFASAPVVGEGADNFAVGYLEHRDTDEEPFYPHSLPVRLLAGTGIVGTALFLGFLVAAAVAVFRTRLRYPDPLGRGVAAVALAGAVYFLLHSSGDWLWTFAGITMPVIAWLGIAGGGMRGREPVRPTPLPLPAPARIGMIAAAALVAIVAAVSLALPWVSARLTDSAASGWPDDPQEAYSRLDTARDLNPLSARPDLVAGTIAIRNDDPTRAAAAFTRAAEREPTNWYCADRARHPRSRRRRAGPGGRRAPPCARAEPRRAADRDRDPPFQGQQSADDGGDRPRSPRPGLQSGGSNAANPLLQGLATDLGSPCHGLAVV